MRKQLRRICSFFLCLGLIVSIFICDKVPSASATTYVHTSSNGFDTIPDWINKVAKQTHLPWYEIAAIHQYEYNLHHKKSEPEQLSHISIPAPIWAGVLNPNQQEYNPAFIQLYGGIGRDWNGDGKAIRENRDDATYSLFSYFSKKGTDESHLKQTLLEYYQKSEIVKRIMEFKTIFQTFGMTKLKSYVFPLPINRNYSYRDTWGAARGWGGRRIHEGTDIFASYGTPVMAVTYAYVETKGWNQYGGWRIGLRTVDNLYIYYAHLSSFAKGIKEGMVVKPGDVIGYVGSSGYGRVGTSGKFPPHLHFGLYRSTGKHEWAFDPYPNLKRWERATIKEKIKQRSNSLRD